MYMFNKYFSPKKLGRLSSLCLLISCFAFQLLAQAPLPPEIENPECLGINKQPVDFEYVRFG